jgi:hypothetical protein
MKQGTMFDFLQLVEEDASLQQELVELAHRHGFEFVAEELTDDELDGVAGGGKSWEDALSAVGDDAQLANVDLQNMLQKQQQLIQTLSNTSKMLHRTAMAVIRKIG